MSHRPDGMPEINRYDELKKTKNIFIVGPQVRQQETIFCFIYKFRLRF
jgi:putative flavoprotein involved in K+ transport